MENKKLNSQTVNKDNSITKTATVKAAVTTNKDTASTTAAIKDVKKEADPAAKDDVKAVKSVTKETDTKAAKVAVKADADTVDAVKAKASLKDKADKASDDEEVDDEEVTLDADGKPIKKAAKDKDKDKDKTAEAPVEELREPGSVFIDHGAILPEFIPGTHLFALIRDPGTLYVYWNSEVESAHGWRLTAFDAQNNILQSFTTTHRRSGRGYFHIPTMLASRVTLEMVQGDGTVGMKLESTIKILEQSKHKIEERWVDVQNNTVVYEAPSPGHAPDYAPALEAHRAQMDAIAGGGIEAMLASAPSDLVPGHAPSSWFGPLRAPGSSDIFIGSSNLTPHKR